MSDLSETFFTRVGCMDGRVQVPLRIYGQEKFDAEFPDTITDPGSVGLLANNPSEELLSRLKSELSISISKHNSKEILVSGHQECAANPVDDQTHRNEVKKSVKIIKNLIDSKIPVVGVFVKRSLANPRIWEVEKLS